MGLVSLRSPFTELVGTVLGKTDLKSMFYLVVFFIIVFVLAYLTNPTENSFRAYLTEQSFRQHLSRLDDAVDDDHKGNNSGSRYPPRHSTSISEHTRSFDNSSAFHFANRASVSLRTPKHVFHSFGLFTIAAIVPIPKHAQTDDRDTPMICDSWYIGAFGHWWRGGIIEAWYHDVIARSKDEESWSSGILNMKNIDMLSDYNGLPFSTKNLPPHLLSRGSPPKLRNREKSSQRPALPPPRSSTPPPLPKSASLPLHTTRLPSSTSFDPLNLNPPQPPLQNHPCHAVDQVASGSSLISRSPSTLFDQSPRIAEVLRQISHSKATVLELRNQLCECQSSSSQSRAILQDEVEYLRDRKRQEDASKAETKSRTKTLDDCKRAAETTRKDVDKKLKISQNARDASSQRIGYLDKEISLLKQRLADDEILMCQSQETVLEAEKELLQALEEKKQEIKVAEDVVATLNQRARELEERLSAEKQRLESRKGNLELEQILHTNQFISLHKSPHAPWQSAVCDACDAVTGSPVSEAPQDYQSQASFGIVNPSRRSSLSQGNQDLSRTNTSKNVPYSPTNTAQAVLRANGYSLFDGTALSLASTPYQQTSNSFSPFSDADHDVPGMAEVVSPPSQSLVPSDLVDVVEGLPRSFQSESDVYMARDWRAKMASYAPPSTIRVLGRQSAGMGPLSSSPVSLHSPHDYDHVPFEVQFMGDYGLDQETRHQLASDASMDPQRAPWVHLSSSNSGSNFLVPVEFEQATSTVVAEPAGARRWFPTISKDKPRKGLNPEAKVFSLSRKSQSAAQTTYDALNPNGIGSIAIPPSTSATNSTSLLRAFAPSPAEREALQRALGGSSSNASFELLPSLSDVGSIPSSPVPVHAATAGAVPHVPQHSVREMAKGLPSWLQSLPRIRKTNFSPWEDEEPAGSMMGVESRVENMESVRY